MQYGHLLTSSVEEATNNNATLDVSYYRKQGMPLSNVSGVSSCLRYLSARCHIFTSVSGRAWTCRSQASRCRPSSAFFLPGLN